MVIFGNGCCVRIGHLSLLNRPNNGALFHISVLNLWNSKDHLCHSKIPATKAKSHFMTTI